MYCNELLDFDDKSIISNKAGIGVTLSILNDEISHSRYKTVFLTLFARRLYDNVMMKEVPPWDFRLVEMLGYNVVIVESLIDDLRGLLLDDYTEDDKETMRSILMEFERQICTKIGKKSASFKAIAEMKREILVIALNRIFELRKYFK